MNTRVVQRCVPVLRGSLTVLLLLGCGAGQDLTSTATYIPQDPTSSPTDDGPTVGEGCSSDLSIGLVCTPEAADEAFVVRYLSGCTDGTTTQIVVGEDSPGPWVMDSPIDVSWKQTSLRPDVATLRSVVGPDIGLIIASGATAAVNAAREAIHVTLDSGATGARLAIEPVWAQVQDNVQDRAVDSFADGMRARKAAVICGLAGFDFVKELGSATVDENNHCAGERFYTYLGFADETATALESCTGAIDDAGWQIALDVEAVAPDGRPAVTLPEIRSVAVLEQPTTDKAIIAAVGRWVPKISRIR